MSAEGIISEVAERLQIEIRLDSIASWRVSHLRHRATATRQVDPGLFMGQGTGPSEEEASARAVMEWLERYAQFGPVLPRIAVTAPYVSVADAIPPPELGLYAPSQYLAGFPCAPFRPDDPIEWVEGRDLAAGTRCLVPIEFIHPTAAIDRAPLVCETSSGTAAHVSAPAAALAALCEVIERDAFMLFWHRLPPTPTLSLQTLPPSPCAEDLRVLQAMGFVVTICCLDNGIGIPCFLVLAFQSTALAYGLGCHPSAALALEHAVSELVSGVTWVIEAPPAWLLHRALPEVRSHLDHYQLYHRGPLHGVLRQALAQALLRASDRHPWQSTDGPFTDEAALRHVLGRLAARGYSAIGFDLTPEAVAGTGGHVARVLVPGLVPIHFGVNRIRLGCRRLIGRDAPGRLSTLLPHFMH